MGRRRRGEFRMPGPNRDKFSLVDDKALKLKLETPPRTSRSLFHVDLADRRAFTEPGLVRFRGMLNVCLPALTEIFEVTGQRLLDYERNPRSQKARDRILRSFPVDEIILHGTASGTRSFADAVRYGQEHSAAHFYIGKEERQIVRLIPADMKARHAGSSKNRDGRTAGGGHNDQAIGIELYHHRSEDPPDFSPWQYEAVSQLCYELMQRFRLKRQDIIPHASTSTVGKTDPKGFDWTRFDGMIEKINDKVRTFYPEFALKLSHGHVTQPWRLRLQ